MVLRKGFYFSFDAIMALTLISASLILVINSMDLSRPDYETNNINYQKANLMGRDAMRVGSKASFSSFNDSFRQELVDNTVMEESDLNRTIMDGIALLWAAGNTSRARVAARTYFDSKIPSQYGYRIQVNESGNGSVIYSRGSIPADSSIVSSTSKLVSGHMIDRPSDGFQARAQLTRVSRNKNKTVIFGGYVGDGNITSNVTIPKFDEIQSFVIEGDISGPFKVRINGNNAGTYNPSGGNMSSDSFKVCDRSMNPNRCSYFSEGENLVNFQFLTENRSISGGFMRIQYNQTEELSPLQGDYRTQRKKIPGINGVINYFGSFHVPGNIQSISADLNYQTDNQTLFMKIGNSTVYEKRTQGGQTVEIDNATIQGNVTNSGMTYEFLSKRTVPLRIGLKNLDFVYSDAIADSVAVIDDSGSMGGSKMTEAKASAKLFATIILNATGNRAGVVGYDSAVSDVHPLSIDEQSINNTIDNLNAGGGTCIGCGILEAINLVLEPKYETLIDRKEVWNYNNSYPASNPPDINGSNWTELSYNDTNWSSGSAILGNGANADTNIVTGENVFFRKTFNYNKGDYENLTVAVRSDDAATVYLNGHLVSNDTGDHSGRYWNRITGQSYVESIENEVYDDFERSNLAPNWQVTYGNEGSEVEIANDCGSATGSTATVFRGGGSIVETDVSFPASSNSAYISYSMYQGPGGACEAPDNGDDIYLQYEDSGGTWRTLKMHDGGDSDPQEGDWETYSFRIDSSEYHDDLKFRFTYPDAAGNSYDYWAADNVTIKAETVGETPSIQKNWINGGKNVISAKLKNKGSDTNSWTKEDSADWDTGAYENTTSFNNDLQLIADGFQDGFSDNSLSDWQTVDNDGSAGTNLEETNQRIEITANGDDTWTGDDDYGAVYRNDVSGNWNATVELRSQDNTHGWAKSGIMVKNDITADGSSQGYAFMTATPSNGYGFQWDSDGDGFLDSNQNTGSFDDSATPRPQVRMEKEGNTFTGYYSEDGGISWTEVYQTNIGSANNQQDVGLAHTSHSNGNLGTAVFDDFSLSTGAYAESGNYVSNVLDAGKTVNWYRTENISSVPPDTGIDINYSDTKSWYDDLEDVPDSRYLEYNISMTTTDTGVTPSIEKLDVLYNSSVGEFDLLVNATEKRKDSMIVMSDGQATQTTSMTSVPDHDGDGDTTNDPQDHSIEAGCRAQQDHNITVYTVGFGSNADEDTLNDTAQCGGGSYYYSDTGELEDVFRNISSNILNASYVGQTIETSDDDALGQLYANTSLKFNYTGGLTTSYGAITVEKTSSDFGSTIESPKNGSFEFPAGVDPVSAEVASYSGNKWTDRVLVNESGAWEYVYQLWRYDDQYVNLGDPFIVDIPRNKLKSGVNHLQVDTALAQDATRGGSPDNKVFYSFNVENFVGYGDLFPNRTAAQEDAEQRLEEKLDLNGDGAPVVPVSSNDYNYSSNFIGDQPYIWGPASVKLVIWK